MILDTLAQAARERVERKKREVPPEEMRERALSLPKDTGFPFEAALRAPGVGVIAELRADDRQAPGAAVTHRPRPGSLHDRGSR